MPGKRIIIEGTNIPCKTIQRINNKSKNSIFIISTGFVDKKKKHTSMKSDEIEDLKVKIKEFIERELKWTIDYDIIFNERICKFFVNKTNMNELVGSIIPTKCFSIQFTEKYVCHFNINKYIEIVYEDEVEETKEKVQSVPNPSDFPIFGSPPVRQPANPSDFPIFGSSPVRQPANPSDFPIFGSSPVRHPYPNYGSLTFEQPITPPKSPTRDSCNSSVNIGNAFMHAIFQERVTDGEETDGEEKSTNEDESNEKYQLLHSQEYVEGILTVLQKTKKGGISKDKIIHQKDEIILQQESELKEVKSKGIVKDKTIQRQETEITELKIKQQKILFRMKHYLELLQYKKLQKKKPIEQLEKINYFREYSSHYKSHFVDLSKDYSNIYWYTKY